MLKILYFGQNLDENAGIAPPAYAIELAGNILRLSIKGNAGPNRNVDASVDICLGDCRGKVVEAAIRDTHKMNDLAARKVYDKITPVLAAQDMASPRTISVAEIAVNEDASEIVALLTLATKDPQAKGEGIALQWVERDKPAAGLMRDHSAFFREFYDKKFIPKCELIRDTDIYDSVAYLEAQVDALTRALLQIMPEKAKLRPILAAADKYSVLDAKPEEQIVAQFAKDKGGFRGKQSRYYEKRAALLAEKGATP
jgi:hypothetical protein